MATRYVKLTAPASFTGYDRARFYPIDNLRFPSVTTILDIINKPALGPWYAKMERQAFESAILEICARADSVSTSNLLSEIAKTVQGTKAADKAKDKAANIGTAAHAWIEWETKRRMGKDIGGEPKIPDEALIAVMAWQDWAKASEFRPIRSEIVLHSKAHGYAGTADWIGYVSGDLVLGDYKTGKAIYPESYLQNVAYRAAALEMGAAKIKRGVIVRLPKTLAEPEFEVAPVPEVPFSGFLSALDLWRCMRRLEGKDVGDMPRSDFDRINGAGK